MSVTRCAFRSFDEDLIPRPQWQQHKERILRDADVPALAQPMAQMLQELEAELEARYETVNRRILSGENTQIKLKQRMARRSGPCHIPAAKTR